MKTLFASVLGLTALTSVAFADEPMQLTLAQMDQITAGAADASLTANVSASGPNNSSATADAAVTTITVGGSPPSNSSLVTFTGTSHSD